MCATFVRIEQALAEHGLKTPQLNVLTADLRHYETVVIQPTGAIEANADGVRHVDRTGAIKRYSRFLRLAAERGADLVVTPEYSCPWEVLADCIANRQLPSEGKLWVLSMESIQPTQLADFTATRPDVFWIHEQPDVRHGKKFLDPVAYVTLTSDGDNNRRVVVVLQFKAHPMGGHPFEQNHLILGRLTYVWHNPDDTIRLVTLICSESLAFDAAAWTACSCHLHPFIFLHPQLTSVPRHPHALAYRNHLFSQNDSTHVEVLALNWARGFRINDEPESRYGGSAIFTKAPEFELSDDRLEANHHKGLFYTRWHTQRTQLCLLSYDPHLFVFRMHKVRQMGHASEACRAGPQMLELYSWDNRTEAYTVTPLANDGFKVLCDGYEEPDCDFFTAIPATALDRERLLVLSAGQLDRSRNWHEVKALPSFIAAVDERSQRLTFTHEDDPISKDYRNRHLSAFVKLQLAILADPANYPPPIHDLRGVAQMRLPSAAEGYRFNLGSKIAGVAGATAVFLGAVPPADARKLRDDLVREWSLEKTRRLVIWYENAGKLECRHQAEPDFTTGSEPPGSIISEKS